MSTTLWSPVRTQTLLTSNNNTLLVKARKQLNFTTMAKTNKKETEQMFKQCECDELFSFAKTKEGILILVGKFRVSSKTFKSFEEAEAYVNSKPYELIINLSVLFNKFENENKETKEKNPETNQDSKNN